MNQGDGTSLLALARAYEQIRDKDVGYPTLNEFTNSLSSEAADVARHIITCSLLKTCRCNDRIKSIANAFHALAKP